MSTQRKVGVLGAGQLALMLAEAAKPLGLSLLCAGRPGDCAGQLAPIVDVDLEDPAAVLAFHDSVDVLTLESENVDASVLEDLPKLAPNARSVRLAQDRLYEKDFLRSQGIATAPYAVVSTLRDLHAALEWIGAPSILKTRRLGYDGRGQVRIMHIDEASSAWAHTGGAPCILEGMVNFDFEVSLIAARSTTGELAFYPLIHNEHSEGILRVSTAPYINAPLQALAEQHLTRLLTALDYVGILTVEFFATGTELIANEMAPRVHNSGHWTIEGADTSQFSQHLRAITGMPLGPTTSRPTVMLNCIGSMPSEAETSQSPSLRRHDYGKTPRTGRKVGHLTFPANATTEIERWKRRLSE